jgi:hypothetical protein
MLANAFVRKMRWRNHETHEKKTGRVVLADLFIEPGLFKSALNPKLTFSRISWLRLLRGFYALVPLSSACLRGVFGEFVAFSLFP